MDTTFTRIVSSIVVFSGVLIGGQQVLGAEADGGSLFDKGETSNESNDALNKNIKVGSLGQIDLHVKDQELSKILQILSLQSQRNIVASKNVSGSISADLYGVDFYDAIDAILQPNGFGYAEKGNFIYVYTAAELKTIQDAERKTSFRVVRLNYINASDASAFVTPLLSEKGTITLSGAVGAGFQPSIADGGANSFAHSDTLAIKDFPENIEEITAALKELDVKPLQALVESTVLQADLTETNAFGVDVSILAGSSMTKFISPLNVVDGVIGAAASPFSKHGESGFIETGVGNTSKAGGFKFGLITEDVSAFVRALDDVTDTTVLANPKLLVLNRQKAELLVGKKLGYISTTATESSETQSVSFLDIGTKLTLRPFISEDGFIRLELKPSISDGSTRTVGALVIPDTITEELTTNVIIRSGQTLVLGGLFKEDTTVGRRQVPGLGDVPVVGMAFKGQDDTALRSEVIFLLTCNIVKDEAMIAASDRASDSIELARIGAREGLLPWSRSRQTSAHVRDAVKHMQENNKDKALWSANIALSLDPTFVEARRIKEQIIGSRDYMPYDSLIKDSVDQMIKTMHPGAGAAAEATESSATEDEEAASETTDGSDSITVTVPSEADASDTAGQSEIESTDSEQAAVVAVTDDAQTETQNGNGETSAAFETATEAQATAGENTAAAQSTEQAEQGTTEESRQAEQSASAEAQSTEQAEQGTTEESGQAEQSASAEAQSTEQAEQGTTEESGQAEQSASAEAQSTNSQEFTGEAEDAPSISAQDEAAAASAEQPTQEAGSTENQTSEEAPPAGANVSVDIEELEESR